jgi:hypothetical protein
MSLIYSEATPNSRTERYRPFISGVFLLTYLNEITGIFIYLIFSRQSSSTLSISIGAITISSVFHFSIVKYDQWIFEPVIFTDVL